MGLFKKLFGDAADELKKSYEETKREFLEELGFKSSTSSTSSKPRRNSGEKTNAKQVKKQEGTVKQPKETPKAKKTELPKETVVEQPPITSSIETNEKETKVKEPVSAPPFDSMVEEAESQSTSDDGVFSARLEALISSALQDGVLTDQEKAILKKRAEKEGEDWDEVEMILNSRLAEVNSSATSEPSSQKNIENESEIVQESQYLIVNGTIYKDFSEKEINSRTVSKISGVDKNDIRSIIIPTCVKIIESFESCKKLESIKFPSSLESIGRCAFDYCSSLKAIDLSPCSRLDNIDDNAFANCQNLELVILPSSLQIISEEMFRNCTSLKIVDLSRCTQLKQIGTQAFLLCKRIKTISFPNGMEQIRFNSLSFGFSLAPTLFFPPSMKSICGLDNNHTIYCFSPRLEELEELSSCVLYVLPEYLESYKSQARAERIKISIHPMPDEYLYFYDN